MPASAATAISEQCQPALTLLLCLALSACVSDEAGRPVTATGLVDLADESVELHVGDQRFTGCRENRLRSVWEHAKLTGIDFRASGEAAGFAVEIGGGRCEVADGLGLQGSAVTVSDQGRRFSGCGRALH
jgi:hypothetical protein